MIKTLRNNALALILALLSPLGINSAFATSSITLGWDANPEPSTAGYTLYLGTESGIYTDTIVAGNTTNIELTQLVENARYFVAVSAYDEDGLNSPLSSEISFIAPGPSFPVISSMAVSNPENGDPQTLILTIGSANNTSGEVLYSDDLITWFSLETFSVSNGPVEISDADFESTPRRFYRVSYDETP